MQQEDDLPPKHRSLQEGRQARIKIRSSTTARTQATAAVVSGKADAMLADSPVVAYAVEQSNGKLEPLGDIYDSAPYGYVRAQGRQGLADAIVAALKSLKTDGSYEKALKGWGVEAGAIDDFAVNPDDLR